MKDFRQIEHDILAHGRVDDKDLEVMRQQLYANGTINRREADFLVELHKRVQTQDAGLREVLLPSHQGSHPEKQPDRRRGGRLAAAHAIPRRQAQG